MDWHQEAAAFSGCCQAGAFCLIIYSVQCLRLRRFSRVVGSSAAAVTYPENMYGSVNPSFYVRADNLSLLIPDLLFLSNISIPVSICPIW